MEALFKNEFVRGEDAAKEIFKYWFFGRPIMKAVYILLGISLLFYCLGAIFDPHGISEIAFPAFMLIFAAALFFFSYRSQVKTMIRRDQEIANGRELLCEVTVNDGEIINSALGNENKVGFESISYAFITKSYTVAVTKARIMYIFKNDAFTKGDFEGFIAFLRDKGIKIKK